MVDTHAAKWAAVAAARRVPGVRAVAQRLRVKSLPNRERNIAELAAAIEGGLGSPVEVRGPVTALPPHATVDARAIGNAENAPRSAWGAFEVVGQVTGLAVIP